MKTATLIFLVIFAATLFISYGEAARYCFDYDAVMWETGNREQGRACTDDKDFCEERTGGFSHVYSCTPCNISNCRK